jgi:hypothetical protein
MVPDPYVVIMRNQRGLYGNGRRYAVVGPFSTAQEAEDWADCELDTLLDDYEIAHVQAVSR